MNLRISLDTESLDNALKQLQMYRRRFDNEVERIIKTLTDRGVEIARSKVLEMDAQESGELFNSITAVYNLAENIGIVKVGARHAMYVEFGTGLPGQMSPHPQPDGWTYNTRGLDFDEGWLYIDRRTGKLRYTEGMRSRPFMWETARELEDLAHSLVKKGGVTID